MSRIKTNRILALLVSANMVSSAFGQPKGRIAYITSQGPARQLWVLDLSTGVSSQVPIAPNPGGANWCRNGELLALKTGDAGADRVATVRPDGSDFRDVTNAPAPFGGEVSISGDCSEIAFHAISGGFKIHTVNADGTNRTVLNAPGSSAEWSPVARKIVYSSWPTAGGTSELFIYDLTTGVSTQITNHAPNRFHRSAWSPDGLRLAVSDFDTGTREQDIWVMNADGSNPVNLTSDWDTSSEGYPSWSSDGEYIVFTSNRSGNTDIWAMRPDGSERVNLTNSPGIDEGSPSIGPPGNAPPTCDSNGPYFAECEGITTDGPLNGSGSSDPDDDPLTFLWTTDCPGGSFDDETCDTPILSVDSAPGCGVNCNVTLALDDGNGGTNSCSATVTINDTQPPEVTCSVTPLSPTDADDHEKQWWVVNYTAVDGCGTVNGSAVIETPCCPVPVSDGQIIKVECTAYQQCELEMDFEDGKFEIESDAAALEVTATDGCGNTGTCTVDLCGSVAP